MKLRWSVPGVGKQWYHPRVIDLNQWLNNNCVGAYVANWERPNLYSDTMMIEFSDEQDAVAFKLRFGDECIE